MRISFLILSIFVFGFVGCANNLESTAIQSKTTKHDPNYKPTISSITAINAFLNSIIKGDSLLKNWCADSTKLNKEFFSPTDFKILHQPSQPDTYNDFAGAYSAHYSVRIWSSNRSGIPIIKDWDFYLKWSEKNSSKKNELEWCLDVLTEK